MQQSNGRESALRCSLNAGSMSAASAYPWSNLQPAPGDLIDGAPVYIGRSRSVAERTHTDRSPIAERTLSDRSPVAHPSHSDRLAINAGGGR